MKTLIFIFLICLSLSGFAQLDVSNPLYQYSIKRSDANAAFSTKAKGDSLQVVQDSIKLELPNKLNVDSASVKYLRKDTALVKYVQVADTATMLAPYLKTGEAVTDTTSLSNRIDLKLNKTDTTTLSNRIDLKADSTYLSNLYENVQQGLNIRLDSLLSDAKYVLKGDSASLYDYVYRKGYIDTLEMKLLKDERVYSFQKLGADTLFAPIGSAGLFTSSTYSLVDNTALVMSYDITRPTKIRGVQWVPSTTGNAEWDGWNGFVLLNSSGTRIDSTANTPWTQVAFAKRTLNFTNQSVLQPGVYYVLQISNWVGAPTVQPACYTLLGANAVTNYFLSSSHKLSATIAGQTTNPASITISTTTNSSTYPGFILYE